MKKFVSALKQIFLLRLFVCLFSVFLYSYCCRVIGEIRYMYI